MSDPYPPPDSMLPAAEPPKKSGAATEYLILSKSAGSSTWTEQKTVEASSAKAAVRKFLGEASNPDGTYVAVPARSWQPVTVKTEQTTKITLT